MGFRWLREDIISYNNWWFKIRDNGDDTPAPSPESKKYATAGITSRNKNFFRFIPACALMGFPVVE
ncbi:unnamed protein product, partial [Callosobruchus maculatus]